MLTGSGVVRGGMETNTIGKQHKFTFTTGKKYWRQFLGVMLIVLTLGASSAPASVLTSYGTWQSTTAYPMYPADTGYHTAGSVYLEAGSRYTWSWTYSRNFFILDLSGYSAEDNITGLSFQWNDLYVASGSGGSYALSFTSTAPDVLMASGNNMTDVFNSLSGGTGFGSANITGSTVTIEGNQSFLDYLNANKGSVIAVARTYGGSTRAEGGTPSMTVTTAAAPEPNTLWLLLMVGVLGVIGRKAGFAQRG